MTPTKQLVPCLSLLALLGSITCQQDAARLQILNGSEASIDVYWLRSDDERVSQGAIANGKDTVITTTLGHRFAIVGKTSWREIVVTSRVLVQGVRYDPAGKD